jgi:6-phosphogluconate dehydrogenase
MEIGLIGLGKMGRNMAARLIQGGHRVVGYSRIGEEVETAVEQGAVGATSIQDLINKMTPPRTVWVMVPSGNPTEQVVTDLAQMLTADDCVIDGGNSNYHDSIRRGGILRQHHIHFLDVGTSGGVWGVTEGYSLMIGGEKDIVDRNAPIFETLAPAPDKGWGHVGPNGAGHFVKMVHNGVEYGLMQAYAEGLGLMNAKTDMHLDLHNIVQIWQHGSVIRSWLLDLAERALAEDPDLHDIAGYVPDSGEGRWTVLESVDRGYPIPVITAALQNRFRSQVEETFGDKVLAALRNQFGGHAVKKS